MKLIHHFVPRLKRQDADWEQSSKQQIDVIQSLTECRLRLAANPRLAALDAEVRSRRAAHDESQ